VRRKNRKISASFVGKTHFLYLVFLSPTFALAATRLCYMLIIPKWILKVIWGIRVGELYELPGKEEDDQLSAKGLIP